MTKYSDSGVNIDTANTLIDKIKTLVHGTHNKNVLAGIGGFAALYELPTGYSQPVLVSCTDGVGTKLKLALAMNKHDSIGQDLVAMCANDLICCGAEPLFFLDYYATGKLDLSISESIIKGIAQACQQSNLALIGGETAEMPGMYAEKDYDLAGFCVGVVEKNKIIDGSTVQAGDLLIGLASSGPHSNGYSLIRKILQDTRTEFSASFNNKTIGEVLLEATTLYVNPILEALNHHPIHAISHITGGGLTENLPRVLPKNVRAVIQKNSWERPAIFDWLQTQGEINSEEMLSTFNCGIGMVLCVPADACMEIFSRHGIRAWKIGHIDERTNEDAIVFE